MYHQQLSRLPEPNSLDGNKNITKVIHSSLQTPSPDESQPPSYFEGTSPPSESPLDITAYFANLKLNDQTPPASTPTSDQCLAHLKLLEALYCLRIEISHQDGLFGISNAFAEATDAELLTKIKEKRWQVYVSKAVRRFEAWWLMCVMPHALKQSQRDVTRVPPELWKGNKVIFSKRNLPPLDVIMVWHAYQLNPRNYLEDCVSFNKMNAWRSGFPWDAINSCIENDSFDYSCDAEALDLFESRTRYHWNSLEDPEMADLQCPISQTQLTAEWTGWNRRYMWKKNENGERRGELESYGFADKSFKLVCTCRGRHEINHPTLRAQKFIRHCDELKRKDKPMQGTCLSTKGLLESAEYYNAKPSFFPNRLIQGTSSSQPVYGNLCTRFALSIAEPVSMDTVRSIVEDGFKDGAYVATVNVHRPTKDERIAVRRMMASYWDNASPFSLDLVGAVIRQGTFIEKMHRIDWIHSPAVGFTMKRLLIKYQRYLAIVAKAKAAKKGQIAVPTLDVDLAWHTHQLCPPMYFQHTTSRIEAFLDHDDKIEDVVLSSAFEWTSKTYQKMFNELYSECTCWYCEAIRESHSPVLSGLNLRKKFGGKPGVIEQQLNQIHSATDSAAEMNHISTHNSITPSTTAGNREIRQRNLNIKLERDYKRAVVKARKQGREPLAREEYYYAYGYPLYMPLYVPYAPDPCIAGSDGLYTANPACATFVSGASGNCAAGSCGGGVAAGACGGGGSCTTGGCSSGGDGGDGGGGCGGCGGCG